MASTEKMGDKTGEQCPMCERQSAPRTEKVYPFCSLRCQMDDLGRWLDEGYRIPQNTDTDLD